jgi:hypothetical protein
MLIEKNDAEKDIDYTNHGNTKVHFAAAVKIETML